MCSTPGITRGTGWCDDCTIGVMHEQKMHLAFAGTVGLNYTIFIPIAGTEITS